MMLYVMSVLLCLPLMLVSLSYAVLSIPLVLLLLVYFVDCSGSIVVFHGIVVVGWDVGVIVIGGGVIHIVMLLCLF